MGTSLAEWVVRTAMLVLAGLVTLSILGSIAAMSNQAGVPGLPAGVRDRPLTAPAPEPAPRQAEPVPPSPRPTAPAAAPAGEGTAGPGETVAVAAPPEPPATERWLEAIAYALLAIAGLLAFLLILLWRGVRALRRIAEATALGQQRN